MKTIGVISDTHGKLPESVLFALEGDYPPGRILRHFAIDAEAEAPVAKPVRCDLIVHAGDVGNAMAPAQWIIDSLQDIAPLFAVAGNCDNPDEYRLGGKHLPLHAAFEECGLRFGVMHDPLELRAAVMGGATGRAYIVPEPHIQVHGHTHVQRVAVSARGIVTVCPGSVSRPREGNPPTIAVLKIEEPGRLLSVDILAV